MSSKRILQSLLEGFPSDLVSDLEFESHVLKISSQPVDVSGLRIAFDCLRSDERASRQLRQWLEAETAAIDRSLLPDDDLRAEICQQTHVLLLYGGARKKRGYLLTYGGRAPLRTWLRTVLVRQCIAQKRRHEQEMPLDAALGDLIAGSSLLNPELELIKRSYASTFRVAFRQSLAALSARERLVLRHHLLEGLTAEQIGRRYRVHRVTVARWMRSIRETLLRKTKAYLERALRKDIDQLDVIFGLIESRIYTSFEGLEPGQASRS